MVLKDALGAVEDALQELRARLVLPEGAAPAREAQAKEALARRYGRRGEPEEPRPEGPTTA